MSTRETVVVVEQTSKRIKLQILLSTVVLVIGAAIAGFGFWYGDYQAANYQTGQTLAQVGGVIFSVGFIWTAVARFVRWWHHG